MGLTDYSDLEKEIQEAPEPYILKVGEEVLARITIVISGVSDKNGATWYMPIYEVTDQPMAKEFNDFFWDLSDRDKLTEKQAAEALPKFRVFAAAFGLDYSRPFDWEDDLPGLEGWIITGLGKDREGNPQNTVGRYVAPK